jgi:hypothetical protein
MQSSFRPSPTTVFSTSHRSIAASLDGKTVRVVLVAAEPKDTDGNETIFSRLRRVKTQGPTDLSTNHDAYVVGERDA